MATSTLEARLSRVEQELAELKAALGATSEPRWYRSILGDYGQDKALKDIVRLGRQIRRGQRRG